MSILIASALALASIVPTVAPAVAPEQDGVCGAHAASWVGASYTGTSAKFDSTATFDLELGTAGDLVTTKVATGTYWGSAEVDFTTSGSNQGMQISPSGAFSWTTYEDTPDGRVPVSTQSVQAKSCDADGMVTIASVSVSGGFLGLFSFEGDLQRR
ncbi:hypothetical protein [Microbacterium rhizomatis]|uniref:Uncharacterized protein n=1 Tax=Microbacterium rhizomatis TaxID=1631477 RepID=A0A5J5J5W1_9MICO|nr:hypothetical protein [Microbacterium rhizomatis]KAA9110248.1 hypothetical protein F6B43_00635 [Microbacterium rhizomatis]